MRIQKKQSKIQNSKHRKSSALIYQSPEKNEKSKFFGRSNLMVERNTYALVLQV